MNKDVIYIDTEDDITAIIGKIKSSKEKIVAIVPPKRVGILQSAVNLRLLARMANINDKRLVLVTNNSALMALSSVAKIPVAKNLQSKPEMIAIDTLEIDDSEDVIDGSSLSIGELSKTGDSIKNDEVVDIIETIDVEEDVEKIVNMPKNKTVKIPDFNRFRKILFIGILVLIALITFLVWALVYAPAATVIITAQTSPAPVSKTVKLDGTSATDLKKGSIQTVSKTITKDVSVQFAATGTKDIGDKATGTITVKNCDSNTPILIPASTAFTTSSGVVFINIAAASVPGYTGSAKACRETSVGAGTVDIAVAAVKSGTAANIGVAEYNIDNFSDSMDIYARGSAMAGGTSKVATVVTADDVQKAAQAMTDLSSESVKKQLIGQFVNGEFVIPESFNIVHALPIPTPAIGAESTAKATLTSSTTFTIIAIAKSEVEAYLNDAIKKQIENENQRMYSNGIDKVQLSGYLSSDLGTTINISTAKDMPGQIGPNINKDIIKEDVKGKRYGDVQAFISAMKGVNNVDIKFSYFWVNSVPNDVNKIDVQFILKDA